MYVITSCKNLPFTTCIQHCVKLISTGFVLWLLCCPRVVVTLFVIEVTILIQGCTDIVEVSYNVITELPC